LHFEGIEMALTDIQIKKAKPSEKPYKLSDSGNLYLWVTPTGGRIWRWAYKLEGNAKLMTFGKYPDAPWRLAESAIARHVSSWLSGAWFSETRTHSERSGRDTGNGPAIDCALSASVRTSVLSHYLVELILTGIRLPLQERSPGTRTQAAGFDFDGQGS
jgi:hypothetical protein